MSQERMDSIRELLFQLEKRIRPLEWDAGRNQINEFKKKELERLRSEYNNLLEELQGFEKKE